MKFFLLLLMVIEKKSGIKEFLVIMENFGKKVMLLVVALIWIIKKFYLELMELIMELHLKLF